MYHLCLPGRRLLPHYADIPESVNAQIEAGLLSAKYFFGEIGGGFYLPYLGWASGFDKILRPYGINYTILDARALLLPKRQAKKEYSARQEQTHRW